MKGQTSKEELCLTCYFYSFCAKIGLPHCEGKDYVEDRDKSK